MERMTYLEFHNQWHVFGCFNIHQIYAWRPDFNRHNLHNWMKKGYIVRLRKEWYAFSDCRKIPDFSRYVANRIYRPSYISLHTALSYYGIIPESVVQITSVTALKTMSFITISVLFFAMPAMACAVAPIIGLLTHLYSAIAGRFTMKMKEIGNCIPV